MNTMNNVKMVESEMITSTLEREIKRLIIRAQKEVGEVCAKESNFDIKLAMLLIGAGGGKEPKERKEKKERGKKPTASGIAEMLFVIVKFFVVFLIKHIVIHKVVCIGQFGRRPITHIFHKMKHLFLIHTPRLHNDNRTVPCQERLRPKKNLAFKSLHINLDHTYASTLELIQHTV